MILHVDIPASYGPLQLLHSAQWVRSVGVFDGRHGPAATEALTLLQAIQRAYPAAAVECLRLQSPYALQEFPHDA